VGGLWEKIRTVGLEGGCLFCSRIQRVPCFENRSGGLKAKKKKKSKPKAERVKLCLLFSKAGSGPKIRTAPRAAPKSSKPWESGQSRRLPCVTRKNSKSVTIGHRESGFMGGKGTSRGGAGGV